LNLLESYLREPDALSKRLPIPGSRDIDTTSRTLTVLWLLHRSNGVYEQYDKDSQYAVADLVLLCDNFQGYDVNNEELYQGVTEIMEHRWK